MALGDSLPPKKLAIKTLSTSFCTFKAAGLHVTKTRDFELLGYQKVNARMMRLCGQRAARQAALASQQRLPVVRRKPKKYRGPTRTPPAKRNDKPQEEEFGRHMRKWLEGEQVPLMPTE